MSTVRKFKEGPEAKCQKAVVKYFKLKYPKFDIIRIGNEGKRSISGHQSAVKQGLVVGASDLFVAASLNGYHGLWLELKHKDFKITPSNKAHCDNQIEFLERMKLRGYAGYMVWGFDEAKQALDSYMTEEKESIIQLLR